ncbi:MAG TPA: hypothetical protein VFN19_00800 [Candidatus Nanopelagicales bacterium]|nr:hypothetical protein [Candidatus Nanopelagicales bacterium]
MSEPRVRLRPGVRVSDRTDTTLQVGLHPGRSLVLPDAPDVRAALTLLGHGVEPRRLDPGQRDLLRRLTRVGLVDDPDHDVARSRATGRAGVEVAAPDGVRTSLLRMLAEVGVREGSRDASSTVVVLVTIGAEPRRDTVDELVRADRPHLLLTSVAGRLRVGPFVVPGLTACLRCLDDHATDRDPRHPLVVEQHLEPDPLDRPDPADLQLALAWAARDVTSLIGGDRPVTWSATVDVEPGGPVTQRWRRHPRCGCAWGDALAG